MAESTEWRVTQSAFDRFLELLGPDRDLAGERYERMRAKLIRFFEWRGCPDPEAGADETMSRIMKKLEAGEEIRDVHTYCYGIARLVSLELYKRQHRERNAIREIGNGAIAAEEDDAPDGRIPCLRQCIRQLAPEQRSLILGYYRDGGGHIARRQQLADALGIPLNALRIRAFRIRESLESCMRRCAACRRGIGKQSGSDTVSERSGNGRA